MAGMAQSERINIRLPASAKALLERAASFEGKSVNAFILGSALTSAEQTVHEHEQMQLTDTDAQRFFDALAAPVEFNQALTDAFADHDEHVQSK